MYLILNALIYISMAARLFQGVQHAQAYSQFRPVYPKQVLDLIVGFIKKNVGKFDLALDVACGSGQSTWYLAENFKRCVGLDVSAAQIECGRKKVLEKGQSNLEFRVGDACDTGVETGSVDLLTCAQAWHWLDAENFYREASRVLAPNGCLAVYGYGNVCLSHEGCQRVISDFYSNTLKGYWHPNRAHIDDCYRSVVLPFPKTERHDLSMDISMSLGGLIGYLSSWSGYQDYCVKTPGTNVLREIEEKIGGLLIESGITDLASETAIKMSFPLFVILGCKY